MFYCVGRRAPVVWRQSAGAPAAATLKRRPVWRVEGRRTHSFKTPTVVYGAAGAGAVHTVKPRSVWRVEGRRVHTFRDPLISYGAALAGTTVVGSPCVQPNSSTSGTITIGDLVPFGVVTSALVINGAPDLASNADYALLAANLQREEILKVPGSGPVRGLWIYQDVLYAVRDNVGATASFLWHASPTGWVVVPFGYEVPFSTGTAEITAGQTVTNQTGTASGVVARVLLRTGAWSGTGVGTLVLTSLTGAFATSDQIRVGGVQKATASAASSQISRLPGGRCEFVNHNFTGSTLTQRMYGVDGINPAFEYDGATYVPIHTGMVADAPSHVIVHKEQLFLSFNGSAQHSAPTLPYAWTVVLGAGELTTGSDITGFVITSGNDASAAMAIFTKERPFILYGASVDNWNLVPSNFDVGYSAYTTQQVTNNTFGLTARGIQALMTTQNYGNFSMGSISHLIQPLMNTFRGKELASNTLREKNQYRVYYSNNYCVTVGLTGDKVSGLLLLNYSRPVRCIVTSTLSTGEEVTFFGSDDGYAYQDNVGTSQDGEPIESWLRLPFNNLKSPMVRKRFRRAVFDLRVEGYSEVNISYDFGFGNPDVNPSAPAADTPLIGSGGFWDQFTWDRFVWDAPVVSNRTLSIDGTETNISLAFYSRRAQDTSHTVQGITLQTTPQRLSR